MTRRATFLAVLLLVAANALAGTGRILILNRDRAGEGFNDPTPATPAGGNDGTTLGAQRMNVFLAAAERWTSALDTNVDIRVTARFAPITSGCTPTSGVLGSAGAVEFRRDFPNAPRPNTWYPVALANKFAGADLTPGDDINMQFNSAIGTPTCLSNLSWYLGLDGKHGTQTDLFVVVLHEISHGLGVSSLSVDFLQNIPSVFDIHTLDVNAGLRWDQMTAAQRRVSQLNTGNLAWDGPNVREAMSRMLDPAVVLATSSRDYDVGQAAFGAPAGKTFVSGRIALAADASTEDGPSATDACTAFTNAAEIAGRIALVDRGTCTFVTKARNAQAAGAIAMIVVDNTEDTCAPPSMSGTAPDVTIPTVSISKRDGDAFKSQITSAQVVNASVRADVTRLAGTTGAGGYLRLYAPCKFDAGSSTYHWDTSASPNLLMEPFVSSDLLHGLDLTLYQLLDIGWTQPPRSGRRILKR